MYPYRKVAVYDSYRGTGYRASNRRPRHNVLYGRGGIPIGHGRQQLNL